MMKRDDELEPPFGHVTEGLKAWSDWMIRMTWDTGRWDGLTVFVSYYSLTNDNLQIWLEL